MEKFEPVTPTITYLPKNFSKAVFIRKSIYIALVGSTIAGSAALVYLKLKKPEVIEAPGTSS